MKTIIPLFPLKLVVFPESKYPLHIFEERYKYLVNKSLSNSEGFGIVSEIDNIISDVGCFVRIENVLKFYDNGSMDIIVKGFDRFKIINKNLSEHGFIEATIIPYLDKETVLADSGNITKLINQFKSIVSYAQLNLSANYWKNLDNSNLKSFKIAEKCGLTINQQQDLLNLQNENERIAYLISYFDKISYYIKNNVDMKNLIMNDGYIN